MDDYDFVCRHYDMFVWPRDLIGLHRGELYAVDFRPRRCAGPAQSEHEGGRIIVCVCHEHLRVLPSPTPLPSMPLGLRFPGAAREAVRRYRAGAEPA